MVDIIPSRLKLLVSDGESIELDKPLTNNPNVGGFGQGDAEIVLQFCVILVLFLMANFNDNL